MISSPSSPISLAALPPPPRPPPRRAAPPGPGGRGGRGAGADQKQSNHMLWFAHDAAARASSCAQHPLHIPAAPSPDGFELCSATRDCTPTLLLLLHTWGGGMQQLWFDTDMAPLLSLPPGVNLLFATSINGADVVAAHMLERVQALQRAGGLLHWLASLLGQAPAAPAVRAEFMYRYWFYVMIKWPIGARHRAAAVAAASRQRSLPVSPALPAHPLNQPRLRKRTHSP